MSNKICTKTLQSQIDPNHEKKTKQRKKKKRKILNENELFVEHKQVSEEVKNMTSNMIAPLAIDEEALGEYCTVISGDEDCLDANYDYDEYMDNKLSGNDWIENQSVGNGNIYMGAVDDIKISPRERITQIINKILTFIPFIAPVVAFMTYDEVAKTFSYVVELVANTNWKAADGRLFQIQTITPAINGIVVPSVSILFATLSGTTISTLRQRQLDIRTCLNMEANEIRALQAMVDSYPSSTIESSQQISSNKKTTTSSKPSSESEEMDYQDRCRAYLIQYSARLITESQPGVVISNLEFKGSLDSEMNGFLVQLNEMATQTTSPSPSPASTSTSPPANPIILSESYGAISRLNSYRSTRISALQSTFPALHFLIVFALGSSICFAFLLETNQDIIYFLNGLELRVLWTMLIGTLAALAVVCYDLSDPFRGSYQISSSIDQLYTIREVLQASDRLKKYQRIQQKYYKKRKMAS